ncbi:MAG: Bug family tripartite tricarboxylate transporter substrate binding protein, partial [Alphaproteobacteria bacterium]
PSDIVARLMAPKMTAMLGQPVIVDNRPGAGGVTGVDVAAKAAPDGYTIGLGSAGGVAISPQLDRGTPYDPLRDLAPLTLGVLVPEPIVVSSATPYRTLQELLVAARANPGKINQGSTGSGSLPHLAGELLKNATGIEMTHVPYRGSGPAATDLIAGRVDVFFDNLPSILPHIRAGTVRALAALSAERIPELPDLPTFAEQGVQGMVIDSWFGFMTPARTPPAAVAALNSAFNKAMETPAVRQRMQELALTPIGGTPEQMGAHIQSEVARWSDVVRRQGIRAE